jgi:hypothetical protein
MKHDHSGLSYGNEVLSRQPGAAARIASTKPSQADEFCLSSPTGLVEIALLGIEVSRDLVNEF